MGRLPTDPIPRFWAKVNKTDSCWIWTGSKQKHGHGQLSVNGKVMMAYRFSYELHKGPIPFGMSIDHLCHNPPCVNPDHLRAATHKQNMENRKGACNSSKSGIRGVRRLRSGDWIAEVRDNGKAIRVGTFPTAELADSAVRAARSRLFSVTN